MRKYILIIALMSVLNGIIDQFVYVTGFPGFQTTSLVLVDVPELVVPLIANSKYLFEANIQSKSDATGGNIFGLQWSGGGNVTTLAAGLFNTLATGTTKSERYIILNGNSSNFDTTVNNDGAHLFKGIFITGSNPGNFSVRVAKNTSGTATVYMGSYLRVTKFA